MMGGVVYPGLECVDKLGIEVHTLKIELWIVEGTKK